MYIYFYFIFFFYHCSNRFHFNPNPLDGGLFLCCGQLVGKKGGPTHINCAGSNSGFKVGGLFLEMEFCPFPRCAQTFLDPESNISHQEEVHRPGCAPSVRLISLVGGVPPDIFYHSTKDQWAMPTTLKKCAKALDLFLFQLKEHINFVHILAGMAS